MSAICPHCGESLPENVDLATCPSCSKSILDLSKKDANVPFGRTLTGEDVSVGFENHDPEQSETKKDTIEATAQTLDGAEEGFEAASTIDLDQGLAEPGDATLAPDEVVRDGGDVSQGDLEATLDFSITDEASAQAYLPSDQDQTEDSSPIASNQEQEPTANPRAKTLIEETLASDTLDGSDSTRVVSGESQAASQKAKTLVEETLMGDAGDLKASTKVSSGKSFATSSGSNDATIDGSFELGEKSEQDYSLGDSAPVSQQWAKAAGESGNPLHTVEVDRQAKRKTHVRLSKDVAQRSLASPDDPLTKKTDYQILEVLGKGAMGLVQKAKQASIDRVVALKTIHQSQLERISDSQQKFVREAQITGGLDHPNIVPIHDMGVSEDGQLFYSMKMVDGIPWRNLLKQNSREENLEILLKVCDAVGFAHSNSVIHRDLKPENVMIGQFGEVLVMDWGLAIHLEKDFKQGFGLGGTPAFMAPEMAAHDKGLIGPKSDIYLLGAILYQVITGYPPHPGRTISDCVNAAKRNVILPIDDSESPLAKIALKAMATDLDERYASVPAFQEALREYKRHAESVALTERGKKTLKHASESGEYESYASSIFAFREAIDIWDGNEAARSGLAEARIDYAQTAFHKTDYDLTLQILDPSDAAESPLYEQAEKAKREASEKEKRIRNLRRAVLTGVSIGLVATLVGLGVISWQSRQLVAKNQEVVEERDKAIVAQKTALTAKAQAEDSLTAEKKAKLELKNKNEELVEQTAEANRQKDIAKQERTNADIERERAVDALQGEKEAKERAEAERQAADKARLIAEEKEREAIRQNRLNLYQNFPATLNNAASRLLRQRDVQRSQAELSRVDDIESQLNESLTLISSVEESPGIGRTPLLKNWAYRRLELLSNQDVPSLQGTKASVQCVDIASDVGVAAISSDDGVIRKVDVRDAMPREIARIQFDGKIQSLAVSPGGQTVMICSQDAIYSWADTEQPQKLLTLNGVRLVGYAANGFNAARKNDCYSWGIDSRGVPNDMNEPVKRRRSDVIGFSSDPRNSDQTAIISVEMLDFVLEDPHAKVSLPQGAIWVDGVRFLSQKHLLAGTESGSLVQFNLDQTVMGRTSISAPALVAAESYAALSGNETMRAFDVSRDATRALVVSNVGSAIRVFQIEGGEIRPQGVLLPPESSTIAMARFLADNETIVTIAKNGTIRRWDVDRYLLRHRRENRKLRQTPVQVDVVASDSSSRSSVAIDRGGFIDDWDFGSKRGVALRP
ncbi:MAG: protein kinase, partial [Planctomycetota bacterium]